MPQPRRAEEPRSSGAGAAGAAGAGAATAAAATAIPATGAAVLEPAALAATTAASIEALRKFWGNGSDDIFWLWQTLRRQFPAEPEDLLRKLAQEEADRGAQFIRKMEARLERDIPKALLSSNDPEAALRVLLEREFRYIRQRQEAMLSRSISAQERESLKRTSPLGAYWRLSPFVKSHTIDCLVMAGKFWPWAVLDVIHPPRHPNCPCRLYGLDEAISEGFLPHDFTPPPPEDGIALARQLQERFAELREAVTDEDELRRLVEAMEDHRVAMNLIEAPYDRRFAKGTVKGGEFMPKVGGFAAAVSHDLKDAVGDLLAVNTKKRGRAGSAKVAVPRPPGGHTPDSYRRAWAKSEETAKRLREVGVDKMPGGHGPVSANEDTHPHAGGPPKDFHAWRGRVQDGVDEAAAAHDAKAVFQGIDVNPNEPDTTALRWFDGRSEIGKDAPGHLDELRANPENAEAQRRGYLLYSRAAHEAVGHGVNPVTPEEYSTPDGYALEEALAEETGRIEGKRWLAADGFEGASKWAEANPDHPTAKGAYTLERTRLAHLLDEAGVPAEARAGLVETMGFRQGHQARVLLLGGLLAKQQGISPGEAGIRVRATLRGERDHELGIADESGALVPDYDTKLPVVPEGVLSAAEPSKTGDGPTDTGGAVEAPQIAAETAQNAPGEPVKLTKGSGPQFFDARHYSDPRRSLLRKMAALPAYEPFNSAAPEMVTLADGSNIKRGPKGSMRFTKPDGESKLYSTPQRLANAETVGVLERHGITDDRLGKAVPPQMAPSDGTEQRAPAEEDKALQMSLAEKPPAPVLGVPSYSAEDAGLTDFKPAGGSNGAQFATDKDGRKWLVKPYRGNRDRVASELLANAVYRELGIDVPNAGQMQVDSSLKKAPVEEPSPPPKGDPKVKTVDGKKTYFVGDQEVSKADFDAANSAWSGQIASLGKATAQQHAFPTGGKSWTAVAYPARDGDIERWNGESQPLGEGFMADALLGNWDVVGLDQDNVLWGPDGEPIRLDQGGTFEFRAMGKPKPYGPVPTEAWTMRAPGGGQAFGRMALNDQMLRDQAGDIAERLTPQRIDALVDAAPFADEAMRERVRENLKARVSFMGEIADGTEGLPGPAEGADAQRELDAGLRKAGGLYPEEEHALGDLADGGEAINAALRSGDPGDHAKTVDVMDALMRDVRSPEDAYVYVPTSIEGLGAQDAEALRGRRLRDAGYLIASIDPSQAETGKAVMRILVPAGAPALPMGEYSTEPGAVLINRGQSVRIAGAHEENGSLVIDAVLTRS
jgi:hypothetical protein